MSELQLESLRVERLNEVLRAVMQRVRTIRAAADLIEEATLGPVFDGLLGSLHAGVRACTMRCEPTP